MDFRVMHPQEQLYAYSSSSQIHSQTGLIGYMRMDMDTDGHGFHPTWNGIRQDLVTMEFNAAFDNIIDSLRFDAQYDGILRNRDAMSRYCNAHPESKMQYSDNAFGFRADAEKYSCMIRIDPRKGAYNMYCYAYIRDWLDRHMHNAEKGIRIISPSYQEKFRLEDGDRLRIITDKETRDYTCRYIDDTHLEVGNSLYHICEFAEMIERANAEVVPLRNSMPEQCYAVSDDNKSIFIIKRGEKGTFPADAAVSDISDARDIASRLNARLGVTKQQEAAMIAGLTRGFDTPAADPKAYDNNGQLLKPKHKSRDVSR